ncbi:hypothetical protein FB45DRAFT_896159 [Roridomyces roridus]|uniref:NAD-dependent epimerase/dehydratase domain-containing protein n=1 Tax=Roridomyces roridus TaxID=1738132 RepID=A0AAD7CCL2_9AGAR|nr:hypothetical protein FB45DRAFT_896159 [Roridomyces roridus]
MASGAKPLVFVTGAAGLLGSEIVYQLLEAGYSVRGAARGRKLPLLKTAFASYPRFEAVEILDVASSDFTAAFKGVDAVIHTAAPLPGRTDHGTVLNTAIVGSLHIIREAHKAGIKKFVSTSTMLTFPPNEYGPDDWTPITKEQAVQGTPIDVYIAEKKFSDQAVLEFADQHPEMDVTIFCPPWIFGPSAPGFEHIVPEPDFVSFSTNGFVYQLLRPENTNYIYFPGLIDVRDVARIHVAALNPLTDDHPKRVPMASPYQSDFRDAIQYIFDELPELRARLADPNTVPRWPTYQVDLDPSPVEKAFGINSYKTWKETVLDAVDRFLDIEKQWTDKGLKFEVPSMPPV